MGPPIPGFIPWTLVMAWADKHGLSDDETAFLDDVLSALCDFDLGWTIEKLKQEAKK